MRHRLISTNPCELVRLPKLERREYEWYNASEINTLLETIKDEPLHPLIQTTVMYGLRRSEVLGLQWQSIDFDTNTILIRHTVSMSTKVVEKDKTKNKSSYRSFPLFLKLESYCFSSKKRNRRTESSLETPMWRMIISSNGRMAQCMTRHIYRTNSETY